MKTTQYRNYGIMVIFRPVHSMALIWYIPNIFAIEPMYTKLLPHVCLSNTIDYYWIEKNLEHNIKILPDGTTSILFSLVGTIEITNSSGEHHCLSNNVIIGAQKKDYIIHKSNPSYHIGIKFRQGGAYHFFKEPMSTYSHQIVHLPEALNGESEQLQQQLLNAKDQKEIQQTLDHYLLIKVGYSNKSSLLVDSLMDKITVKEIPNKIKDLSNTAKISHKHLITLFNQIVGLPPKLIHRINKFTQVINLIQEKEHITWSQVAYKCQYYDQAHLINDFKGFSGISPKNYYDNKNAVGLRVVMT